MKNKYLFFFIACILILIYGFSNISSSVSDLDENRVKKNLDTALITCYSVEGKYPSDLSYLSKNYGFVYDSDAYFITYDWQGQNVYPTTYVYRKGS
jgi:hypothetical protein